MEQQKLERINTLARKQREGTLTEEERAEQQILRREYADGFRAGLKAQLDSIVLVEENGERRPLKQRGK